MTRLVSWVAALGLAGFLVAAAWLAHLDAAGPPHTDVVLEGGVPATIWLPGEGRGTQAFLEPPPPEERAPALVLMHGLAGDRRSMSGLAWRVAEAGYVVLAIDAAGHGENRSPLRSSWADAGSFSGEMRAAVDFLRSSPFVDPTRLAVGGHSMGAGAALDFASRDSGLDATILISGGWRSDGPHRPPNALFLVSEAEPEPIRRRVSKLAAKLNRGVELEAGESVGRLDRLDAVRLQEIAGANHATIVTSDQTLLEIVAWLDGVYAAPPRGASLPEDPRSRLAAPLLLGFLLLLPGLGLAVGGVAPRLAPRGPEGRLASLGLLATALLLGLPLASAGAAGVPLLGADQVVALLALAGVAALACVKLLRPAWLGGAFGRPSASVAAALVALVVIYFLLQPFGTALHRLALTPERFAVFTACALGFLPFSLAQSLLLRRGGTGGAALASLGARALVFAAILLGGATGLLEPAAIFALPAMVTVALPFELLAAALYATSHDRLCIALVDAGWLALVVAAVMPIRI